MIKISKYIYIHPLTVFMFVAAYITRSLESVLLIYLVMLLHELSHTLAAVYLRLGVSRIIMYPFGVSLTVKTRILCSLSDKIILYLSGPLINAAFALIMAISGVFNDFYYNNLILFILNLMPMLPLDGGRLLEEFILSKRGEKFARRVMLAVSLLTASIIAGVIVIFASPDINSFSFLVFMLGSVLLQKPKYSRDYLKQLALTETKTSKSKVLIVESDVNERKLVKDFSPNERTLVVFCAENGRVESVKTDREIICNLLA